MTATRNTDRDGKRTYRSTPKNCTACPCKSWCGANEKGQKLLTTHIWQEYLDLAEEVRKNEYARMLYRQRKESIERVFADAKEKHAMRYTHHRGLAAVTRWVRLKYAAMNLKKLANWSWKNSFFFCLLPPYTDIYNETPVFLKRKQRFFDRLRGRKCVPFVVAAARCAYLPLHFSLLFCIMVRTIYLRKAVSAYG